MGRIKGWNRVKEDHYIWGGDLIKIPYGGSENRPKVNIMLNRFGKWAVFYNGKSGFIREKSFKTKQEALNYAIKYMRSHPNG